jgi:hypothetical protein
VKYVYFITTEKQGFPIKIGITNDCNLRIRELQIALPYKIKVLAVVPTDNALLEKRLHMKFSDIRLEGEWFRNTVYLRQFIEKLKNDDRFADVLLMAA